MGCGAIIFVKIWLVLFLFKSTYDLRRNIPEAKFIERLKRYSDEELVVADISKIHIEVNAEGFEINPPFPFGGRDVFPRIIIKSLSSNPGELYLQFKFENSVVFKWMLRIAMVVVFCRMAFNIFREDDQANRFLNNPFLDIAILVVVIALLQFDFNNKVNAFVRFVERLALMIEKEG